MNPYVRYRSAAIPFPAHITITLPFSDACSQTERRAKMEESVDFRNDPDSAKLCTLSYAASELARYLRKVSNVTVSFDTFGHKVDGYQIDISCGNSDKSDCSYTIAPISNGMSLYGNSRVGALYAVYSVLNSQGIRWYYPGPEGEIIPPNKKEFLSPIEKKEFVPAMKYGRGLDIFAPLKDSAQFLLWMARNRMNITADHVYSAPLGDKLGMTFRIGGHMFEPFLHPDTPLKDGRTIWEAHPEWYGLPKDGIRKKEDVLKNQFCVSSPGLIDYLADILISKLRSEWKHVDRFDIWRFDNGYGSSCQCEKCQKLGNDTDQDLFFVSELRRRIDKEPDLHPVTLVACSYEGTNTMDPPTKPIPENLFARDCIVSYPIHRCYCHDFDDPSCPINAFYQEKMLPWFDMERRLPMIIGEYYNVSRYEDLPLVFSKRIRHEIPMYARWGFESITYMHPPLYNWGVRALNHMLFAELSWAPDVDSDALLKEYFTCLYGKYSSELKEIYDLIETSGEHIGNYRNWWYSVLNSLLLWKGNKPDTQLDFTNHFTDHFDLIRTLEKEWKMKKEALRAIEGIISRSKYEMPLLDDVIDASNPADLAKTTIDQVIPSRLYEIRRSLIYGVDEIHLFKLVVEEYNLAFLGKDDPNLWAEIESVYDKMAEYFYPHRYISKEVEAFCEDGLTRSQLRKIIDRRRAWKLQNGTL